MGFDPSVIELLLEFMYMSGRLNWDMVDDLDKLEEVAHKFYVRDLEVAISEQRRKASNTTQYIWLVIPVQAMAFRQC